MRDVILRLLGVWSEQAGHIVKVAFGYHGDLPLWIAILLGLVLTGLVFYTYHKNADELAPWRKWVLAALRSSVLCLLILILIHPIISVTTSGSIRQTLLLLVDTSRSMRIADMRIDDADAKRAAIANGNLDPFKGLDQRFDRTTPVNTPRIDLVKDVLKNSKLKLLPTLDRDFDIAAYSFDRDVRELAVPRPREQQPTTSAAELLTSMLTVVCLAGIAVGIGAIFIFKPKKLGVLIAAGSVAALGLCIGLLLYLGHRRDILNRGTQDVAYKADWIDRLSAVGNQTAIGDGVRDAILRKRGQPLASILLITDGGNNAGSLPTEAAKLAREENLPIYAYGVGITSPRDIIVGNLFAQNVSFVKDEVPVTVRVRGQGLKGQTATVVLKLGDTQVDSREITFEGDSEQVLSMKFTPPRTGDFELSASVEPRSDEVVKDNNSASRHIRIIDGRIKVLVVDELPRWEFKYLQAMLLRDRRVDAHFLLLDADPAIADTRDSPYIKQFPGSIKELATYDLVMFGDVDPRKFSAPTMNMLGDFVSKFGGSMVMLAGKSFSPQAYKGSPLEKLLPVEFEFSTRASAMAGVTGIGGLEANRPIKLELTPSGKAAPMLRLADNEAESAAKWAALPPIFWEAKVTRPKPAADVLVVDPDPAHSTRWGKLPVIVVQQYGLGSVLYIGTDNLWRWRKNTGDVEHQRLWGQIIERMALLHLLGGSKRTQLSTDRENYATGDRVTVYARLYSETNLEPLTDPTIHGAYNAVGGGGTGGGPRDINLRALPDQPGMYRGEFVAPAAGSYRLTVDTDPNTPLDFTVSEQTLELGETALNVTLLSDMAKDTRGQFLREEDLHQLPEMIKSTAQQQLSTIEVEFCYSPIFFMLLVGLLAGEWTMRKLNQLK
jgi:hypothetical protein